MAARQQQTDHDDDYDDYDDGDGDDGGDGESSRILSLESINDALAALTEKVERALSGGGRGGGRRPQPGGSGSSRPTYADTAEERRREIRDELGALRAQEQADKERGEISTRLGKVEKALERPPRQLRRVEEWMGWHR